MAPARHPTVDGDTPVERVAISGATLAALLQAVNFSRGDFDGVLFGHVDHQVTSTFVDEDMSPQASQESTAIVTGHYCSGRVNSFYDATGCVDAEKLADMMSERKSRGGDPPIGWYVGRRGSAMRPSMRESTVTTYLRTTPLYVPVDTIDCLGDIRHRKRKGAGEGVGDSLGKTAQSPDRGGIAGSMSESSGSGKRPVNESVFHTPGLSRKFVGIHSSSPCIFFLFTESIDSNSIHTHEYRAFQFHMRSPGAGGFEPRSVSIINTASFRGLYNTFVPSSPLPWFLRSSYMGGESSDEFFTSSETTNIHVEGQQVEEQTLLKMYSHDFSIDRLKGMIRMEGQEGELEALYKTMLRKLEQLAKCVCEGNNVIAEQVCLSLSPSPSPSMKCELNESLAKC